MDKTSERKGTTPQEMAEWIVSEWRSVRGSDRMLVIAITEALKVIPAAVGDLEAEIAELRDGMAVIPASFRADAVVTAREEYAGGRMVKLGVTTSHLDCVSRHVDEFAFRMPVSEEAGVFAVGAPLVVTIRRAGSLGGA